MEAEMKIFSEAKEFIEKKRLLVETAMLLGKGNAKRMAEGAKQEADESKKKAERGQDKGEM